jgi:mevalonate kinase
MTNKQKVVEFLIENDELVKDIIRKTNEHIQNVHREFYEEAKEQQLDEINRQLADEIGKSLGLTVSDLNDILDMETLRKIMEVL